MFLFGDSDLIGLIAKLLLATDFSRLLELLLTPSNLEDISSLLYGIDNQLYYTHIFVGDSSRTLNAVATFV